MAEPIQLNVTAKDDASKTLDEVKAKGDALNKEKVAVDVTATDQASDEIAAVSEEVGNLDGTSATVTVEGDDQASDDVARVDDELGNIDGNSATVTVEGDDSGAVAAVDDAQSALDDFDGASASATIDADDSGVQTAIEDAQGALDDFAGTDATATLSVDDEASAVIEDVQSTLDQFNGTEAIASVSTDAGVGEINKLIEARNRLRDAVAADVAAEEAYQTTLERTSDESAAVAASDEAYNQTLRSRAAARQTDTAALETNSVAAAENAGAVNTAALASDNLEGSTVRSARSLSRMGAATGGATKEAAQMANAFFGLEQVISQVFGDTAKGAALAGGLASVAGPLLAVAAAMAALNAVGKAAKETFGPDLAGKVKDYSMAAQDAGGPTSALSQQLLLQAIAAKDSSNLWDDLQRSITNTVGAIKDGIEDSKTGAAAIQLFNKTLKDSPGLAREMAITLTQLADAGKVSWQAMDTATNKLIEHEQAAGVSSVANERLAADQKIVTEATKDGIDTTRQSNEEYGHYIFRLEAAIMAHNDYVGALKNVQTAEDDLAKTLTTTASNYDTLAKSAQDAAKAIQDQADAARAATDDTFAAQKASDDYAQALDDLPAKLKKIAQGHEDTATKGRETDQLYRDLAESAAKAADAQVKLSDDQAAANGITQTSTQKIDEWNHAMLTQATQASPQAQAAVLDYIGSVNQIPPDKLTAIKAAVEAGDLTTANQLLADASKTRTADINADAHTAQANQDLDNAARTRTAVIQAQVTANTASLLNQIQAAFGGRLTSMTGTPYSEEGIYTVGEAGPERVYLPRGSRVDSAGVTAMTGGGGGTVNNYYLTVNAPPLTSPADVGTAVIGAIKAAERRSGSGWRRAA